MHERNTLLHIWNVEQRPPFDLDALLVFGKVVESRSLSKAATLLGMPKSTVSRKLTKLSPNKKPTRNRDNHQPFIITNLTQ